MPYYATSQEWLHQSSLLIEARPTTTRITTKYHISKPKPRRIKKTTTTTSSSQPTPATTTTTTAPRGSLTLKTYDPHSGACLKYRTTKAAEVSRLILSLGQPLGARMAALPLPEAADEVMADVGATATPAEEKGTEGQVAAGAGAAAGAKGESKGEGKAQGGSGGAGGGGGKGKKKKGKK
ncbi:signal recognition particle 9 kDa protein-domain-containing protein [Rostrohypoxylon terebratum]|nr:signal recognition particle 9 kDa protein-domain-containing protein [Rostrohypoxylon terebratum]